MGVNVINISVGVYREGTARYLGWSASKSSPASHEFCSLGLRSSATARKRFISLMLAAVDGKSTFEAELTSAEKSACWDTLSSGERDAVVDGFQGCLRL